MFFGVLGIRDCALTYKKNIFHKICVLIFSHNFPIYKTECFIIFVILVFHILRIRLHIYNFWVFVQFTLDSFKRFSEEKLPDKKYFYSSVKDGTANDNDEKLDGHISNKDYLTCKKIWNELNMKKYECLSRSLFEKRCFFISWCFWKVYWYMLKILRAWSLSLF